MPRPIDSREVPTDMGSFVRASIGDRIFVYAWIDILIFGYVAYLQGFSSSPVLFAEMIILAIMRIAAFFCCHWGADPTHSRSFRTTIRIFALHPGIDRSCKRLRSWMVIYSKLRTAQPPDSSNRRKTNRVPTFLVPLRYSTESFRNGANISHAR